MKAISVSAVAAPAVAIALLAAGSSRAAPPVPFYKANVSKLDKLGSGSVVIETKDSLAAVCAWYRKNLRDQNGESITKDGAHLFYTHNGATVSVEPGDRFAPGTSIGLVWDARKFGPYAGR